MAKVGNNDSVGAETILEHKEVWDDVKELHTIEISLGLAAAEALDLL